MARCALLVLILLGGCASAMRQDNWPSLQRRDGERETGGPVCPACGPAGPAVAAPVLPQPAPLPLPGSVTADLDAAEARIARIEAALPAQITASRATAKGDSEERATVAEVQRTRLEALAAPLADIDETLDAIADAAAPTTGAAMVNARVADLKARIVAAQAAATRR